MSRRSRIIAKLPGTSFTEVDRFNRMQQTSRRFNQNLQDTVNAELAKSILDRSNRIQLDNNLKNVTVDPKTHHLTAQFNRKTLVGHQGDITSITPTPTPTIPV